MWGQRVTSLVPIGDSLMISTSPKGPCRWEPRFDFVGNDKWKEYGAVIRLKMPGNLCAPVAWTDGPTELRFVVTGKEMIIAQDGRRLASTGIDDSLAGNLSAGLSPDGVMWGNGVFGPFAGTILRKTSKTDRATDCPCPAS